MYSIDQEQTHPQMRQTPMDNLPQQYQNPGAPNVQQIPTNLGQKGVEYEGRIYSLEVVQQPIRARMCGFGDKDRRPITPPPCVRLIVRDAATKKEIDPSEIDTSYFVLTVDLWSADGTHEVNLVRHSASSPSISTASASSFPPPPTVLPYPYQPGYPQGGYPNLYSTPGYNQQGMQYGGSQQSPYYPMNSPYYPQGGGVVQHPLSHVQAPPTGMFTRNLIGSLSASAFQLTDVENRLGIWFILQDLSVRTEGNFRLKMNFVNVGIQPPAATPGGTPPPPQLNVGSAPILATVFSDMFSVFSAKKFPGVIESTPLSKCFAIQGIKIPIRKDGVKSQRVLPPPVPQAAAPPRQEGGENEEWEE
ncbi:VelB [Ascosphaera apis ARSEF 7405]|uniref:VelB n=1 Tax=Ascosphaera apis ARSEF 7405 TaxID=392613 RepID=A0A167Y926_9EURO|nr:VelB [Ascosphaera apis ARSEF 7405]